jgi:hypothetical protein
MLNKNTGLVNYGAKVLPGAILGMASLAGGTAANADLDRSHRVSYDPVQMIERSNFSGLLHRPVVEDNNKPGGQKAKNILVPIPQPEPIDARFKELEPDDFNEFGLTNLTDLLEGKGEFPERLH